ncbi:MAG TPA: TetR/AcrR family transcriptional regulator [Acidimicrobiia bacterium]|jgi:AcrR family transcriptional regulator|nr:TetR/AcrR family transcriptional regulator [Acidimicrobiia bacterium]
MVGMLTDRGRASRERIVAAAATLFHERGVHATSVDEVLAASGAGKSQFYHYFPSKSALVRAVLDYQLERLEAVQAPLFERLDSWDGIADWLNFVVGWHRSRDLLGGCPIGSLAAEMADWDEDLRRALAEAFARWESFLARGLQAMRDQGRLSADADPAILAETTMAMTQGGILLATTKKDIRTLEATLAAVLAYLRSFDAARGRRPVRSAPRRRSTR